MHRQMLTLGIVSAALGMTLVAPATGNADSGSVLPAGLPADSAVVSVYPGQGYVAVPAAGARKGAWGAAQPGGAVGESHDQGLSPAGSVTITPPGGTSGAIKASGYSFVRVPALETHASFEQNSSTAQWLGARPFNATSVTHTDTWGVDGVNISASIPAGVGFSGSNSQVQWQTAIGNNWASYHNWNQVYFSAFAIYRIKRGVSGAFQFGSSFYASQAMRLPSSSRTRGRAPGGRHPVRGTARGWATAVLVLTVAACTGHEPAPSPAASATATVAPDLDAAKLVRDSWVSDGRRGYFVDGAWQTRAPAFSLYETRWRAALEQRATSRLVTLAAPSLARWVPAALTGGQPGSGLPALAQVAYAADLLRLAGAHFDPGPALAVVESLRAGDRYRSSAARTEPDWGSTAAAVHLLATLGAAVPPQVADAYRHELGAPPGDLVGHAVSDLQGAVDALGEELRAGDLRATAVGALRRAAAELSELPTDVVRLDAQVTLRRVAAALGVTDLRDDASWCGRLVRPDGGVALPAQSTSDPQGSYLAQELGCRGARTPPPLPHSRAGWPTPTAAANALPASLAAVRIAQALRLPDFYSAGLRVQLPAWPTADPADALDGLLLAAALGGHPALDVHRWQGWQTPAVLAGMAPVRLVALLMAGTFGRRTPSAALRGRVAGLGATTDVLTAATLEAATRLFGDPALHDRAARQLPALAVAPRVYRPGPGAPASLYASALAAWITGVRPTADDLRRAGLCRGLRCADLPGGHRDPEALSLLPAGTAAVLGTPGPVAFPLNI